MEMIYHELILFKRELVLNRLRNYALGTMIKVRKCL
uniref:Uncharacterized protein n=1 Tax=virus sp. ctrcb4 TaxID=2825824 RepID=A0A8S5RPF2_9VIRU|nr:MAG TPA: hypothetical protein [virus sp. ctrcb4]